MTSSPSEEHQDKKYLFIDTCIIQLAGSSKKAKAESVQKCLQELAKEGYSLAISEISLFENLHGLWGAKATEAATVLHTYEQKIVSNKVLIVASMIGGLYASEKIEGPSVGDKIIGATSFLERGFVLTENHRDYPNPFFTMVKHLPLYYLESHHHRTLDLAIYKPNYLFIERKVAEKEGE